MAAAPGGGWSNEIGYIREQLGILIGDVRSVKDQQKERADSASRSERAMFNQIEAVKNGLGDVKRIVDPLKAQIEDHVANYGVFSEDVKKDLIEVHKEVAEIKKPVDELIKIKAPIERLVRHQYLVWAPIGVFVTAGWVLGSIFYKYFGERIFHVIFGTG